MSIFWQNSNNLAKKCSTTPAGPVHSSPAKQLNASRMSPYISVVRDSVVDIRNSTTNLNQLCLLNNTKNYNPDDDETL